MDAKEMIGIVVGKLSKKKAISAEGDSILLHPKYDFTAHLSTHEISSILRKLERDDKVIEIFRLSDLDPKIPANYFDIYDEPNPVVSSSYSIGFLDGFDGFAASYMKADEVVTLPSYLPLYLQVMLRAINELKICEENQPQKKVILEWLKANYPDLSDNDAGALATFVRLPEKKAGGWQSKKSKKDVTQKT